MPMTFKAGDSVRQIVHVIEGPITNVAIVDMEVAYEVTYKGADGEQHTRFFKEGEIEAVPLEAKG